ncbi:MAG: Protoporphyrinogen oxidase-like protein [Actinomycetia bacterium]|nr:Protoporphyrinogen oxidase-like protein [Actinomycetes bacterium]
MTSIAVLGGGPAGLYAAWKAAAAGHDVVVHERAAHVGGMAASFDVAGVRVDHGSHRLHPATDPGILAELRALLGDDLQWRPRNGRIRLEDRWVKFPLSLPDVARRLPPSFAFGVARDAVTAPRRRPRADTFAEVVRAGLGPTMLGRFYGPYARKLWGLDPELLSGEQARRRIAASSPAAMVGKVVRRGPAGFWYPTHGFGQLTERLAEAAVAAGAEVRCGSEVTALDDLDADLVWSTLPLTALAGLAGGPEVGLTFRALVLVYLVLDRPQWTSWDAHYLPGPETVASRVSEPRNYRIRPADPTDRTVLCAEVPCQVGDATWTASGAELGALVAGGLARCGLPDATPTEVVVRRLPTAYPVYGLGFEAPLAELEAWAATVPGVVSFGRGGLFAHDNTHHALAEGRAAAACLGADGTWDHAAWTAARAGFAAHVVED